MTQVLARLALSLVDFINSCKGVHDMYRLAGYFLMLFFVSTQSLFSFAPAFEEVDEAPPSSVNFPTIPRDGTHGRLDVAPIFVRLKILESGHTKKTLDMGGGRIDGTFQLLEGYGFCLKPSFYGASGDGDFLSAGLALGHYTPVTQRIAITPTIGWTYSDLKSTVNFPEFGLFRLREKFKSNSVILGIELAYQLTEKWYVTGIYQYGFSRSRTKIADLINAKGNSQGSNWGLVLDYYVTCHWLVSGGFAYNDSLSKEKHGIKGYGVKLGIGYWY